MATDFFEFLVSCCQEDGAEYHIDAIENYLALIDTFNIPVTEKELGDHVKLKINPDDLFHFDLDMTEKFLLTRTDTLYQLPFQIRSKILNSIDDRYLDMMRKLYPIELQSLNHIRSNQTYDLIYLSKRTNFFENRTITTRRVVSLGSQLFIEAYCFRRKSIRWFEYGRIKSIKTTSFTPIPDNAEKYERTYSISFSPYRLNMLKWYFRDTMKSYTSTTMSIAVCDYDYLLKELMNMNDVQLLKT